MTALAVDTDWVVVAGTDDVLIGTFRGDCGSMRMSGLKSPAVFDKWRLEGREELRVSDGRMIDSQEGSEVIGVVGGVAKTSRSGE